jgi:predicted nucleic acid-binding protein
VIVLDTSGLLAALDADQRHHRRARQVLADDPGPLLLSPFVLAELDFLLLERVGVEAERALLDEVARGAYDLVGFGAAEVAEAADVLGTLDERHFRPVRPLWGKAFTLLPADQS